MFTSVEDSEEDHTTAPQSWDSRRVPPHPVLYSYLVFHSQLFMLSLPPLSPLLPAGHFLRLFSSLLGSCRMAGLLQLSQWSEVLLWLERGRGTPHQSQQTSQANVGLCCSIHYRMLLEPIPAVWEALPLWPSRYGYNVIHTVTMLFSVH